MHLYGSWNPKFSWLRIPFSKSLSLQSICSKVVLFGASRDVKEHQWTNETGNLWSSIHPMLGVNPLVLSPWSISIHIYIQYNMCIYIYIKHGCKNLLEIAFLTSFKWGNHETRWWIFQCLITSGFFNSSLVFGRFWSPQIMAFGFKTVSLSRWWRSKFEGIPYWIYMDLLDWNRIDIN